MNQLAEAKRTQLLEEGLAIIYRSQVTPGHAQVALDLKPSLCLGVVEVVGGWATVPGVPTSEAHNSSIAWSRSSKVICSICAA